MTTYYNKVLEAVDPAVYSVNPAAYLGYLGKFGQWSVTLPDPYLTEWVHFNTVLSQNSMRVNRREPKWADGEAAPVPGVVPLNWFSWSYTVTWGQFKSLEQNPNGLVAQTIMEGIKSQEAYFAKNVDKWLMNRIAVTGTEDQADDWHGFFSLSTANTVSDPNDSSAAAGTETNLTAVMLSGTAAAVEAVQKSFGVTKAQFYQQYDSNTEQAMYTGNDTFDIWGHPAAFGVLEGVHGLTAAGEIGDRLVLDEIRAIGNINPTMAVDADYDGASTTEASFVISMNTKENFKVITAVPYTVTDWEEFKGPLGKTKVFRKMGFMKFGVMSRPYRIGSYYKKAAAMMRCEPYTNT